MNKKKVNKVPDVKNMTPEEINKQLIIGIDLSEKGKDKTTVVKRKDNVVEEIIKIDKIQY